MKKKFLFINFIVLISFFIQPPNLFPQTSGYKILDNIKIGGAADWDYLSVCEPLHELFISHYNEVDVINLYNNFLIGKIEGLEDVHGSAFAMKYAKGFISDGKHNSVVIFNLKNFKVIKRVKTTGFDPDAILYDPYTERVFAFNGHSTNATAIDAGTNKVIGKVLLSGEPEFGVSDYKGNVYVNIEKKNEIDVINPKSLKVVRKWPVLPCERPSAMAIDRKNNILFIGARNKLFAAVDAGSGKLIATFPIGPGADAGRYDPETHLIFCSTKDGAMSVFKEESKDRYKFLENIKTLPGAKTMALDKSTHKVYTSTMLNSAGGGKTFGVLILGTR